jgi:XRE family aerobic/anaerobic benzoate catabolism transcriptional regulator
MEELLAQLGVRVRGLRQARGLTVKALAERSGLSARYLVELENGRGNISVGRLHQLVESLGAPLASLFEAEPSAGPDPGRRVARLSARIGRLDAADLDRVEAMLDTLRSQEPTQTPVLALLGVRGAGKTTVGRAVATALALPFVELDGLIEESAGLALSDIFAIHGAGYYRRVEYDALNRFLAAGRPAVLATGGSLVTHEETFSLLRRSATTVWLRAHARDLWSRVLAQGDDRPMRRNPHAFAQLEALLAEREPLYRRAHSAVDTSAQPVESVVAAVVSAARRREPGPVPLSALG